MSPEKMVHMANQIAIFFKSQPEENRADQVAGHLTDLWEPRMRAQLLSYIESGGQGLDDLVLKAAHIIQQN
ncbi:formate dehydrogenase subunit delta [Cohaesibacter celericrescens]|uniref:Formate dehydrogenase n=1 Tax=Cohaesibacter celericrescens TaxID=2067669 RepID=A0A2N5XTW8_9HYPH|nr:formate dehydrogenase subunit delta [Cohaesibacter celericrescens]PLW77961.1 formate dehydrogenase [Cohaesibacter celericrescens]